MKRRTFMASLYRIGKKPYADKEHLMRHLGNRLDEAVEKAIQPVFIEGREYEVQVRRIAFKLVRVD